jgi:hypothetical protein
MLERRPEFGYWAWTLGIGNHTGLERTGNEAAKAWATSLFNAPFVPVPKPKAVTSLDRLADYHTGWLNGEATALIDTTVDLSDGLETSDAVTIVAVVKQDAVQTNNDYILALHGDAKFRLNYEANGAELRASYQAFGETSLHHARSEVAPGTDDILVIATAHKDGQFSVWHTGMGEDPAVDVANVSTSPQLFDDALTLYIGSNEDGNAELNGSIPALAIIKRKLALWEIEEIKALAIHEYGLEF